MEDKRLRMILDGMLDIESDIEKLFGEYDKKFDRIIELLEAIEANTRRVK